MIYTEAIRLGGMVRITFYGGAGEVGGNKILLDSGKTRLMLDFGSRMGYESDYFAEFLDTRTATSLKDRLLIGALPRINGIYRKDLLVPIGLDGLDTAKYKRQLDASSPLLRIDGLDTYEDAIGRNGQPGIDAILLSHAHLDHTGDISFLHNSIPLYCSSQTKILIDAIDEITSFKSEAISSKKNFAALIKSETSPTAGALRSEKKEDEPRPTRVMEDGETRDIGDFRVRMISVDHSVPGASSFIIESAGMRILYTGDIRFHGNINMTIDGYVDAVGGGIDVMICEGTRIDSNQKKNEKDVEAKIAEIVARTKGLVLIDFGWKDTTRYETILNVAKETDRIFVMNGRLAYILQQLGIYPGGSEPVRVFLKRKGSALYSPADYNKQKHECGLSVNWTKDSVDTTHYDNGLTARQIMEAPGKYILMMSFYDMGQIFDFANADGKIPDSWFIRAQCEPFCDEMEIDEERMINWLDRFGIGYDIGERRIPEGCTNDDCEKIRDRIDRSHVSGHASRPELVELISKVKPKMLIPVHTPNPDKFFSVVEEIERTAGTKIVLRLPEIDEGFDI